MSKQMREMVKIGCRESKREKRETSVANSVDPDQTAALGEADQGPHCLLVC